MTASDAAKTVTYCATVQIQLTVRPIDSVFAFMNVTTGPRTCGQIRTHNYSKKTLNNPIGNTVRTGPVASGHSTA